jgi:hypothetical protein
MVIMNGVMQIKSKRRDIALLVKNKKLIQNLNRKLEDTRPFGRLRLRWDDNITIDLKDVRYEDVDWIHVIQDEDQWRALVRTIITLYAP